MVLISLQAKRQVRLIEEMTEIITRAQQVVVICSWSPSTVIGHLPRSQHRHTASTQSPWKPDGRRGGLDRMSCDWNEYSGNTKTECQWLGKISIGGPGEKTDSLGERVCLLIQFDLCLWRFTMVFIQQTLFLCHCMPCRTLSFKKTVSVPCGVGQTHQKLDVSRCTKHSLKFVNRSWWVRLRIWKSVKLFFFWLQKKLEAIYQLTRSLLWSHKRLDTTFLHICTTTPQDL